LNIEGAFNMPHRVVYSKAALRRVPTKFVEWIRTMLDRQITTSLRSESVEAWIDRGYPQNKVLSPLLWCLVTDKLLKKLNNRDFRSIGYINDLTILIQEPFLEMLLKFTQGALEVVQE